MTHEHKTESQQPEQQQLAQQQPAPQQPEQQRKSPAARDPLHGVTLETMLKRLVARYGWEEMGDQIPIRCFLFEPSIKSSLAFLRRTQWARKKVEDWYAYDARRFPMEQHDASTNSDGEKPK